MPPGSDRSLDVPPAPAEPAQRTTAPGDGNAAAPPSQQAEGVRRKRSRRWLWIFVAAVIAIALFFRFRPAGSPPQNNPAQAAATITAAQSRTGTMNVYIVALGTVTPVYTVTVYSQVTGLVIGVFYQQGQMVRKGDLLVEIDPRPYQAQLTQAQGALVRDQAALRAARVDLDRYRAAGNAVARQTTEDQAHLVEQLEGTVKADQGAVAFAEAQLAYCHIVAPINGRVGLRLVDPGNVVFAGSSSILVVITQLQPITVVFSVAQDFLPDIERELRAGHSLPVDTFDRSNSHLLGSGMLVSLNNIIDTTTGTVKFRADFSNANRELFPNQFVNARLRLRTLRNVTLVPSAAVQYNGTDSFVYVVQPNHTVSVQPVTVLNSNDQDTAVSGINAGTTVATSGFDRLENGVPVSVASQAPPQQQRTPQSGSRTMDRTPPGKATQ